MLAYNTFDEAVRRPQTRLLAPELKEGAAEQITVTRGGRAYTQLWSQCGAMATVYKYRLPDNRVLALRCFHTPVCGSLHQRYIQLERFVQTHPRLGEVIADFTFYSEGIWVYKQDQGQRQRVVHPLLSMEWVNGGTLLDIVHQHCQQQDRQQLRDLVLQFQRLIAVMDEAQCAHGDLAGGNIMVREQGQLALIDLDHVYIPLFQGQVVSLVGQPDYQHPEWRKRRFNEHADDFSRHVIFTALYALSCEPSLWGKYVTHGRSELVETHLLFREQDFAAPSQSPLFADLEALHDPILSAETQLLKAACKETLETLQLPALPSGEGMAPQGKAVTPFFAQVDTASREIVVRWDWPENTQVQFLALAWRFDRWPEHPQESGTYLYHPVWRRRQGDFQFCLPAFDHIYIQAYHATLESSHAYRVVWSYQQMAGYRCELSLRQVAELSAMNLWRNI
jgi:serine/threonine protein kinase